MLTTLRSAQVETLKCKLRSGGDMKKEITRRWRHANANYAQVET
jgi:transcriptional regulator